MSLTNIHVNDYFIHFYGSRSIIFIIDADIYNNLDRRVLGNPREDLGLIIRYPGDDFRNYVIALNPGVGVSDDEED